jgi:hypothetical protein
MGTRDKRIDTYIEKSPEYARPILTYLREVVHEACPEVVEEMKWSRPHWSYKGLMCGAAAFKQHCAFGFWKGSLIFDTGDKDGMGHFGRLTSVKDLPPKRLLIGYIREAKRLNEEGIEVEKPKRSKEKKELVVPAYFTAAVKKNKKALAAFEAFPYSHKKEYVEWVTEAKTEETRDRRMATTVEWLAEGKSRNWKYEKC